MQLDDLRHQGKPDACPFVRSSAGALYTVETLEYMRKLRFGDSKPGIAYLENGGVPSVKQRNVDPARLRELKRIGQ